MRYFRIKFGPEHEKILNEGTHLHTFKRAIQKKLYEQERLFEVGELTHHPARFPNVGDDYIFYSIIANFTFLFILPLVLMTIAGKLADERFGTHYLALIGLFLALSFGSVAVYRSHLTIVNKWK